MDWNFVKIFLAIYQAGNIACAAKKLKLGESTLFRRLNEYEKIHGKLFLRKNGEYTLAELGVKILNTATAIDHHFDELGRKVMARNDLSYSMVRVTAPTSFSYWQLPSLIKQIRTKYKDIQIALLVTNDLVSLEASQAEIAIRVTNTPPENYIGVKVRELNWSAFASEEYLLEHKVPKNIGELKGHALIGAAENLLSVKSFRWLRDEFYKDILVTTDDLISMFYLAERGQGVAFLPEEFNRQGLIKLFTLEEFEKNDLWVLTHSDYRDIERVRIIARHLADGLGQFDVCESDA